MDPSLYMSAVSKAAAVSIEPSYVEALETSLLSDHAKAKQAHAALDEVDRGPEPKWPQYNLQPYDYLASQTISMRRIADVLEYFQTCHQRGELRG